jgi:hypothetical protein
MASDREIPLCPANAALVGYAFVRHVGLILDELSSQGLDVWQDERQRWRWRWLGTDMQAERGFWALGEALVDAVVTRYPDVFAAEVDDSADGT